MAESQDFRYVTTSSGIGATLNHDGIIWRIIDYRAGRMNEYVMSYANIRKLTADDVGPSWVVIPIEVLDFTL